jgi:hypothetical protein
VLKTGIHACGALVQGMTSLPESVSCRMVTIVGRLDIPGNIFIQIRVYSHLHHLVSKALPTSISHALEKCL